MVILLMYLDPGAMQYMYPGQTAYEIWIDLLSIFAGAVFTRRAHGKTWMWKFSGTAKWSNRQVYSGTSHTAVQIRMNEKQ